MEAQWSPQWSLNGGTMVVQGRQTCRSNWYTMFAFFTGRPMADHCASILRPRRCVCLHPASFERPVSNWPPRRPLCDCFEHDQNFTATMASVAMSERLMCHHWTTKATVRPPFCLQRRPGQFCGRTRGAQRSQPLCKGGITDSEISWVVLTSLFVFCIFLNQYLWHYMICFITYLQPAVRIVVIDKLGVRYHRLWQHRGHRGLRCCCIQWRHYIVLTRDVTIVLTLMHGDVNNASLGKQ